MTDESIVELYWSRSEDAISETAHKYGGYCFTVANNILDSREDSEECVNDTYMRAWDSMPEARPRRLSAFLAKITRNLALNRRRKNTAKKRGGAGLESALDELSEVVSGVEDTEKALDEILLAEALDTFLASLGDEARDLFVLRYFSVRAIAEIAEMKDMNEGAVRASLFRTRKKLAEYLRKEGFDV